MKDKPNPYPSLSTTLRTNSLLNKPEGEYPIYPFLLRRVMRKYLNEKEVLEWAKWKYKLKFRTWAIKNASDVIGSVTSILRPWPKNKKDKDPTRWICQICFLSKEEDLFSKFDGQRWACYKLFKRGIRPIVIEDKSFKEIKPAVKEIIMEKIKEQKGYREYFDLPDSQIDVV